MNNPERSITVNKIGGVNMSKLNEVLNLVKVLCEQNEAPVLVVSAFKGVTNALIATMDERLDGTDYDENSVRTAFKPVLDIIDGKIDEFIKDEQYKALAREHVNRETDICVQVLMTHKKVTNALAPDNKTYKTRDQIIAFGERSVIGVLEAFLKENGIEAKAVNDISYIGNDGKPSKSELHRGIQKGIAESLAPYEDKIEEQILIIGGHIKDVLQGMVKEIGRSYTDTTAVDVAVALNKLGIPVDSTVAWKEVDGVLSADPKHLDPKVNTPIVHHDVSLNEGMENAGAGSTLMQVEALDLALEERMPLSLKNIMKPHEEGTTFGVGESRTELPFKIITANKNVDVISCKIPKMAIQAGFAGKMTDAFGAHEVSINDIITSSTTINFTVNLPGDEADKRELRKRIRKIISQLRNIEINGEIHQCNPEWDQSKANVVIIGDELRNNTGILNIITGILAVDRINIDGIEHTIEQRKISFYIDQKDAEKAVQSLHRIFIDKDTEFARKVAGEMEKNIVKFLK